MLPKDKMGSLQAAMSRASQGAKPAQAVGPRETSPTAVQQRGYKAPSRAGKTNVTAYLPLAYKSNLRLIQARLMEERGGKVSTESLVAEALNDLFGKYDVPVITHE